MTSLAAERTAEPVPVDAPEVRQTRSNRHYALYMSSGTFEATTACVALTPDAVLAR